ncbi:hypothetical protein FA13DRAFT_1777734 [Coprinellus micaceus]|uniref:F-box domain-containing protein n=1 Tax=Coprinellus micaceus TaxID=71717 RepID=A0A4Y7SRZ7_COPMI|nr:hypothetical protein FA13DRAFT_1777734 [Coprinellus micaceus]
MSSNVTTSLDSPYSDKLRKNYIAQPKEEAGIRMVIKHHRTVVREMNLQLEDINQAIIALFEEKRAIQGLSMTTNPSSPAFFIFPKTFSRKSSRSWPADAHWPRIHPIVQISHVCRQWRENALSNPMLWTTLEVKNLSLPEPRLGIEPDLQRFQRRMERSADMFPVLISRAAGFPMTLSIRAEDPTGQHTVPAYARSVLPVIIVLRENRWEKMNLYLTPRHPDSPLLQFLQFDPRSYQSLHDVSVIFTPDSVSSAPGIVGRLNLHDLEHLSVLHLDLEQVNPLDIGIRWKLLTEIHLYTTLNSADTLRLMAQCPNLTRLTTGTCDDMNPLLVLHPQHSVTMSFLRTLRLVGETGRLLQRVALPALSSLQLMEMSSFQLHSTAPQWLRAYGAQLQRVAFNYDRLNPSSILDCLKDLSAAVSLEIGPSPSLMDRGGGPGDDALSMAHRAALGALTLKLGEAGTPVLVCPKLENIIIHSPNFSTEVGEWVELLASRRGSIRGAVAFIKTVEIRLPDPGYAEQDTVLAKHSEIYDGLTMRGVSIHGIKVLVEKHARWADTWA